MIMVTKMRTAESRSDKMWLVFPEFQALYSTAHTCTEAE